MNIFDKLQILFLVLISSCLQANSNKVLELSDKFLDIYNNTTKSWLVKFYTPSCHLCKKLEADYMHVAQAVHDAELKVIVAKLDAYRFPKVAKHFNVDEYPSLVYIDKTRVVKYDNNKYKHDIFDFVKRMLGDQIKEIDSCEKINQLAKEHESSFVYFNSISSFEYNELADMHIKNTWFYLAPVNCFGFEKNGIYSIKKSLTNAPYINKYDSGMRITLKEWVDFMHFPKFINITSDNFNKLLDTNKMLVIVLVKKYISINRFAHPDHEKYLTMLEKIPHLFLDDYYLFGWSSEFEMISNVLINNLEQFPTFIVLNASTLEYYHRPELNNATKSEIVRYLEQLKMDRHLFEIKGGNTLTHKVQRKFFKIKNKISKMYHANPLMTFLLFALPSTMFMVLLCGCLRSWSSEELDEKAYLLKQEHHQKLD